MPLTDMKLTKAEAKVEFGPPTTAIGGDSDVDRYPYGLLLELDKHALKKLGIDTLPKIGISVTITGAAKVTRVSASVDRTQERAVSLQITALEVEDLKA